MQRFLRWLWLLPITLVVVACGAEEAVDNSKEPDRSEYVVELTVQFDPSVFDSIIHDISPRTGLPQKIVPYMQGWLEIQSITKRSPDLWQVSLEQVPKVTQLRTNEIYGVLAHPKLPHTSYRKMELPGYVCTRFKGLPSADYEFLAIAMASSCRPIPAELPEIGFDEAKKLLPPRSQVYKIEEPIVIDTPASRSSFVLGDGRMYDTYVGGDAVDPDNDPYNFYVEPEDAF